jgi:hypothetical protein
MERVTVLAVIDCVTRSREQPSLLIVVQRWKDVCGAHPSCVTSKATTGTPFTTATYVDIRLGSDRIGLPTVLYCLSMLRDRSGPSFHVGQWCLDKLLWLDFLGISPYHTLYLRASNTAPYDAGTYIAGTLAFLSKGSTCYGTCPVLH